MPHTTNKTIQIKNIIITDPKSGCNNAKIAGIPIIIPDFKIFKKFQISGFFSYNNFDNKTIKAIFINSTG